MLTKTFSVIRCADWSFDITPDIPVDSFDQVLVRLVQSGVNTNTPLCKLSLVTQEGYTEAITAGATAFTVVLAKEITAVAELSAYDLYFELIQNDQGETTDICKVTDFLKFEENR